MKFIKHSGIIILCSLFCFLIGGCDSTDDNPVESTAASSSETSSSVTPPVSSSSSLTEESSAPSEQFSVSITKAEVSESNRLINGSREFEIDNENHKLTLEVTYDDYIDLKTLQSCVLEIETDGAYSLTGAVNSDGSVDLTGSVTVTVTDRNGITLDYPIEVNRTVYELPVVNLYLANGADVSTVDRDIYSEMAMYIDCSGASGFESTDLIYGGIHGRGHSTWMWEKKPYRIKLNEKAELLGLPSNKDWILLSNYCDESLIRNIVAYDMGRELDSFVWTPTQYSVDLFVNGEYRGVYALGEQREIAKSKINLTEDPTDPDRGYLIEVGGADGEGLINGIDKFHVKSKSVTNCTFIDPKPADMTDEQRRFIIDYVNAADSAIVNGGNYEEYIDVDSFADWIIIHELTCNLDSCFRRSCYFTKDRGGKLKMGPIWDFDLAFGNFVMDDSYYTWFTIGSDDEDSYIYVNWCNYLMANERFRSRIRERWFEVRDKLLAAAEESIDRNAALVSRSQTENYKLWDTLGKKTGYQSWATANLQTYDEQVEYLRNFIKNRAAWIDAHI